MTLRQLMMNFWHCQMVKFLLNLTLHVQLCKWSLFMMMPRRCQLVSPSICLEVTLRGMRGSILHGPHYIANRASKSMASSNVNLNLVEETPQLGTRESSFVCLVLIAHCLFLKVGSTRRQSGNQEVPARIGLRSGASISRAAGVGTFKTFWMQATQRGSSAIHEPRSGIAFLWIRLSAMTPLQGPTSQVLCRVQHQY
jgi:hypothetical protein